MRTALLLLAATAACARSSAGDPGDVPAPSRKVVATQTRVTGFESTSLSGFVPAVVAVTEGGECETIPIDGSRRMVLMSFPSRVDAQRVVALQVGPNGAVLNYSDLRGDRRPVTERTRPLTAITVNFELQAGTAANEWPGRPNELAFGTPADFLAAENLGRPGEMLKLVTSRCIARPPTGHQERSLPGNPIPG